MIEDMNGMSCALPHESSSVIRLGHGSGGKMTGNLIENVLLPILGNDVLSQLEDAAIVSAPGLQLAVTTDSYVVSPIFFPGGDIGSVAVHGTVNDLAMRGAQPLAITAAFILEEGLPIADLSRIAESMRDACRKCNVQLIAADTKVVGRGSADRIFITTTGIGAVQMSPPPSVAAAQTGDLIVINGDIGRHGMAIMAAREGIDLETTILSDSAPLHEVVQELAALAVPLHCLRDITRGGLASVLNEIAIASRRGIVIQEADIAIDPQVRAVCELLGLDPLYVACEGRFVSVVDPLKVEELLSARSEVCELRSFRVIGRVVDEHPGRVVLRSLIGGNRIVDKLSGEQLPRIC